MTLRRATARGSFSLYFLLLLFGTPRSLTAGSPRTLPFTDRVAAQEAIERASYSHQIGTTRPFEEAVPRAVLEQKVRAYLKESVALEEFLETPVTGEMLHAELEPIARDTWFPDRLLEIYHAPGDDLFLVEECFVRPVLVDRFARSFYAFDPRLHASARAKADALRGDLVSSEVAVNAADPRATPRPRRRDRAGHRGTCRVHRAGRAAFRAEVDPHRYLDAPEGEVGDLVEHGPVEPQRGGDGNGLAGHTSAPRPPNSGCGATAPRRVGRRRA